VLLPENSPYYGQGATIAGPYGSVENEVPFKSKMLGTLQAYDNDTPRSSRVLHQTSGDSCSNYAIGALDCFPTLYYEGAAPPIYKFFFLDLNELVVTLCYCLMTALTQQQKSETYNGNVQTFYGLGLQCTYTQFFIAVRQQVLWMFSDSQCLGQFLSFQQGGTGPFLPFVCGSNCYPQFPGEIMNIPVVINENLRSLMMCVKSYDTKKYENNRNHLSYIPVWGAFKNFEPLEDLGWFDQSGAFVNLFLPEADDPDTPNVFDGTTGSDVADFNNTPLISGIIQLWNNWVVSLGDMWGGTTAMGGKSYGSPFLQYTRYVKFSDEAAKKKRATRDVSRYPMNQFVRLMCKEIDIEVDPPKKKLERQTSKETPRVEKKEKKKITIFAPNDNTVFSEYTIGYSGANTITDAHKENFPKLILPIIEVSGRLPGITQIQSATLEPHSLILSNTDLTNLAPRGIELLDAMIDYVPGLAGKKSELNEYVSKLSETNSGGFLGDLFSVAGTVAGMFGI